MTTGGLILLTFTPLSGLSDVVMLFLPGGDIREQVDEKSGRFVVMATWDDVPHLDERTKEMLFASYMPFQRDARTQWRSSARQRAIYPVPESDIVVPDFHPRPLAAMLWHGCRLESHRRNMGERSIERRPDVPLPQHYRGEAEPVSTLRRSSRAARGYLERLTRRAAGGRRKTGSSSRPVLRHGP